MLVEVVCGIAEVSLLLCVTQCGILNNTHIELICSLVLTCTELGPFSCWLHLNHGWLLLVSWCFKPSQAQRITSGLSQLAITEGNAVFYSELLICSFLLIFWVLLVCSAHSGDVQHTVAEQLSRTEPR